MLAVQGAIKEHAENNQAQQVALSNIKTFAVIAAQSVLTHSSALKKHRKNMCPIWLLYFVKSGGCYGTMGRCG